MRHRSPLPSALALWAIASTLFFGIEAVAQQPKVLAPHRPVPPRIEHPLPSPRPVTLRSMVGGFWMTDANFKSSIYLKNNLEADPLSVTPILYLSNGRKLTLPDVKLEPADTAVISVNDALQQQNIVPWATLSGYVEIQYRWRWDPLCVTVRNLDSVHSLVFVSYLRGSSASPQQTPSSAVPLQSNVLEGVWWRQESGVTGFVTLSNVLSQPLNAKIRVSDSAAGPIAEHTVTVSPHGTKLVNLNEIQWAASLRGGVRVTWDGPGDGLVVNGGLKDESVGYSARLPMQFPPVVSAKAAQRSYAAVGLMSGAADPMMQFPAGTTFTPYSVVRNISDQPMSVTPSLWWMEGSVPHSAQLRPFVLPGWHTQSIDVPVLLSQAGLKNFNGNLNLVLDADGVSSALLIATGSVDQKNTYVFEVTPSRIKEGGAKSLSYWSTGSGDDTMVTLWNPADEAQDFVFTLLFSGGHYRLPIHLEARATRMFNISEVIHSQIPDDEGNVIPATVHEGSAQLAGSEGEAQRILIATDAGTYNVQKATCYPYCYACSGVVDVFILANPFAVGVGATTQLTFTLQNQGGSQYDDTKYAQWSSTDTTKATVNVGLVQGVRAGSVGMNAVDENIELYIADYCSWYRNDCPDGMGGGGGGAVLVVTISIQSSGTIPTANSARGAYFGATGSYNLGNFVDSAGFCTIGYQATGALDPSDYTGTVTLVRTKGGADYNGTAGQTLYRSYQPGTNDTSDPTLEVTTPVNSVVYDLDAPGMQPLPSQIWRKRMNFFENAQIPDGTYVATEVGFYVRLSCNWASGGNFFATDVPGDNVLGMGSTKTTWNLR